MATALTKSLWSRPFNILPHEKRLTKPGGIEAPEAGRRQPASVLNIGQRGVRTPLHGCQPRR